MPFWIDFGPPNGAPKTWTVPPLFDVEIALLFECRFCRLQVGLGEHLGVILGFQDAIWGSFLALLAAKLGQVLPKTTVHINVADIAEIDKDKTLQPPGAIKKGRVGGGVPPWGRQSAARTEGKGPRRVR